MEGDIIYCRFCGAPGLLVKASGVQRNYCDSCKGRHVKEKRERTMKEQYGVSNPSELPSRKEVMARINAERKKKFASGELVPHFKGQTKETNETLKRVARELSEKKKAQYASGELVPWNKGLTKEDSESLRILGEKISKRKKGKSPSDKELEHLQNLAELNRGKKHSEERKRKTRSTNLENYGFESYLSLVYEEGLRAIEKKYGGSFPESEEFHDRSEEIFERMKATNLERYGFEYAMQNKEVIQKLQDAKRRNRTFKSSREESTVLNLLKEKRKEVWIQCRTREYPFLCDFYLPSDSLYIELNFHWTHGPHPFDRHNQKDLAILEWWEERATKSEFYKNAIEVWTERDVEKKSVLEKNNLNHRIFYSIGEFMEFYDGLDQEEISFSHKDLSYDFEEDVLKGEFRKFLGKNLSYNTNKKYSNLVLPFVWKTFYQQELRKWEDRLTRERLIQNRCSYLHKLENELTSNELFSGFSKSLIHKGYSAFSPFVMKSFIQEYSIGSIYDPCGGWGQRLLGAWNVRYHYNDFNLELVRGIEKMYEFYSVISAGEEKTFSCEDASTYVPEGRFDAVFTCPPYFNTEDYQFEGDSSKLFPCYEDWLNVWWRNVIRRGKQVSDVFAYVISERYTEDMNRILGEESFRLSSRKLVSSGRVNHMNISAVEYLHVFHIDS